MRRFRAPRTYKCMDHAIIPRHAWDPGRTTKGRDEHEAQRDRKPDEANVIEFYLICNIYIY